MGNFIPVEPEKWAEMVKAAASSDYWRIEAETDHARWLRTLEENEKLRAEVERLRKAGDWQPIKTAPKDGTKVLGYCDAFESVVVMTWFVYLGCRAVWETVDGESEVDPTHWMPLPKPPQEGKQS